MDKKKNLTTLRHKGAEFTIWQDDKDNWIFTYNTLQAVNTQRKELQPALNEVYDSIEASRFQYKKPSKDFKKPAKFSKMSGRGQRVL